MSSGLGTQTRTQISSRCDRSNGGLLWTLRVNGHELLFGVIPSKTSGAGMTLVQISGSSGYRLQARDPQTKEVLRTLDGDTVRWIGTGEIIALVNGDPRNPLASFRASFKKSRSTGKEVFHPELIS